MASGFLKWFRNPFNLKSKKAAYSILVINVLLIIANVWNAYPDNFNLGFYLRTIANILLLISMVISINHIKNKETDS